MVGEVDQRIAQGRELPVEHGHDARLGRVEDHVVEPVVAMHDAALALGGHVLRQPFHQAVGGFDGLGFGGLVLARPAGHLALQVGAGAAVVGQADGRGVHAVQRRHHAVHLVVVRAALGGRHAGQGRVPEDAAFHMVHHVKHRADDAGVFAQGMGFRHRHLGLGQRADDAELAVHRMGRGQQVAQRLAAQARSGGRRR